MAGEEPSKRQAFDKSQSAPRGGSVAWVLLIALALIAAAAGTIYIDRADAGTYILLLLAVLGTIGVLRCSRRLRHHAWPAAARATDAKAVVDNAFDGIVVTDQSGACSMPMPPTSN